MLNRSAAILAQASLVIAASICFVALYSVKQISSMSPASERSRGSCNALGRKRRPTVYTIPLQEAFDLCNDILLDDSYSFPLDGSNNVKGKKTDAPDVMALVRGSRFLQLLAMFCPSGFAGHASLRALLVALNDEHKGELIVQNKKEGVDKMYNDATSNWRYQLKQCISLAKDPSLLPQELQDVVAMLTDLNSGKDPQLSSPASTTAADFNGTDSDPRMMGLAHRTVPRMPESVSRPSGESGGDTAIVSSRRDAADDVPEDECDDDGIPFSGDDDEGVHILGMVCKCSRCFAQVVAVSDDDISESSDFARKTAVPSPSIRKALPVPKANKRVTGKMPDSSNVLAKKKTITARLRAGKGTHRRLATPAEKQAKTNVRKAGDTNAATLGNKSRKTLDSKDDDSDLVSCPCRVVHRQGVRKSAYIMDSQEMYVASMSEFRCPGYMQIIEELCNLLNEGEVKTKSAALAWVKGEDV